MKSSATRTEEKTTGYFGEVYTIYDAARIGTPKHFVNMFESLVKIQRGFSLVTLQDVYGQNVLHHAVSANNTAFVKFLIEFLGKDAGTLCRTVNSENESPFDYAWRKEDVTKRNELLDVLLPHMLDFSMKKLDEKIHSADVLAKYPEALKDEKLATELQLGCDAINFARDGITVSSSHLQLNQFTPDQKFSAIMQMDRTRTQLRKKRFRLTNLREMKKAVDIIKANGAANCGELALLVCFYLKNLNMPSLQVRFMTIINGDHNFVYLNDRVVIDPWAGEVFPVSDLENKLHAYAHITFSNSLDKSYNFIKNFKSTVNPLGEHDDFFAAGSYSFSKFAETSTIMGKFLGEIQDRAHLNYFLDTGLTDAHLRRIICNKTHLYQLLDAIPSGQRWKVKLVQERMEFNFVHYAVNQDDPVLVRRLVCEAELVPDSLKRNMAPMHMAAKNSQANMIRLLAECKANPDIEDEYGCTPAWHAAKNKQNTMITELAKLQVDFGKRDHDGISPFSIALDNEDIPMLVRMLLSMKSTYDLSEYEYSLILSLADKLTKVFIRSMKESKKAEQILMVESVLDAKNVLGVLLHKHPKLLLSDSQTASAGSPYIAEIREYHESLLKIREQELQMEAEFRALNVISVS